MEIDQLLLAKVLWIRGQDFLRDDDDISLGIAISLFQDSAEVMLRAIAKHVDAVIKEKESFDSFWDKIQTAKKNTNNVEVPFKSQMIDLNKVRVNFKHYGLLPNKSLAFKFVGFTESFLHQSMNLFFGINLEDVSMADIIRNDEIKEKIKEAEQFCKNGKFRECVESCAIAAEIASDSLAKILPRFALDHHHHTDYFSGKAPNEKLKQIIESFTAELKNQRELLIASLLNLNLPDLVKFKTMIPSISRTYSKKVYITWSRGGHPSEEDARFSIKFMIDYSLIIQNKFSAVGEISTFYFYH